MPTVVVVQSSVGPDKQVEVVFGAELVDVADDERLPIPFSCRSASCATCLVEVLEGADLLDDAEEDEIDLLDMVAAPNGSRLACQVRIGQADGLIRLRPVV